MPRKILAFAGSARKESVNKKLIQIVAEGARKAGAEVTVIDLRDYELPLYDGDLEDASGLPENARKLKKLFLEHDGLLLACPEYNSSITPLLKNTIDWVSRKEKEDEPMLVCFTGKVAGLVSAAPGALGGLRGLVTVRMLLGNIGVLVVPNQMAVSKAYSAFNDEGAMVDARQQAAVESVGAEVAHLIAKIKP